MKKSLLVLSGMLALGLAFAGGSWVGWRSAHATGGSASARAILHYSCPMHPAYHSDRAGDCPFCGMRLERVYAEGGRTGSGAAARADAPPAGTVKISPERQQDIGVQVGQVERRSVTYVIRTSGRVAADERRVYRITAATSGWIEDALPNSVGSLVRKDEVLGTYYAREFQSAQQAYFYALDAKDRFMAQKASEAQMAATNSQIQQSADTLRAMGMSAGQIEALAKKRERTYSVEIRSPAAGFVLTRNVSPGQRFESGDELYVIGDLDHVWILADVSEYDAKWLRSGSGARVIYQSQGVPATVSEVLPIFDDEARTMKFRLELPNPAYRFKPGMFVDVEFPVRLEATLTVPASAVVDSGTRKTVFVDRGNGYFEPRSVESGWRLGEHVEILKGLMAGDRVALSGTFLLDSESRIQQASAVRAHKPETDPVCGMDVDLENAVQAGRTATHKGATYYFCSDQCKKDFEKNPGQYIK